MIKTLTLLGAMCAAVYCWDPTSLQDVESQSVPSDPGIPLQIVLFDVYENPAGEIVVQGEVYLGPVVILAGDMPPYSEGQMVRHVSYNLVWTDFNGKFRGRNSGFLVTDGAIERLIDETKGTNLVPGDKSTQWVDLQVSVTCANEGGWLAVRSDDDFQLHIDTHDGTAPTRAPDGDTVRARPVDKD